MAWTVKQIREWLETCKDDDIVYILKRNDFEPLGDGEIATESDLKEVE